MAFNRDREREGVLPAERDSGMQPMPGMQPQQPMRQPTMGMANLGMGSGMGADLQQAVPEPKNYGTYEAPEQQEKKMTTERVRQAMVTLLKYKAGKAQLERRVVASEEWWKQRHWQLMWNQGNHHDAPYSSAWLFNCIINRHADAIQSYPMANILPREEADKDTASKLSAIVPCILESIDFEETYNDVVWQKLKQGTGIYGIFWDNSKLGGLGDIDIRKIEVLNLFWEPGIRDIQESRNIFQVSLVDVDILEEQYPELKGQLNDNKEITLSVYKTEDHIDTDGKALVVDWYYHTYEGGKKKLHYCKFTGDHVLYSSEDDTTQPMEQRTVTMGNDMMTGEPYNVQQDVPVGHPIAEEGWYQHGMYPFVFDPLFPIEGTPCGFSYVDVLKSPQEQIDLLNQAIIKNSLIGATPRYFIRNDGSVNEEEFADITKPFVHVDSNLGEDTIMQIQTQAFNGNYLTMLNNKITELKETSNNTDASNGITAGVTAASGIAAQQEAAGKTSRASTMSAYRAYCKVIRQVLELIAQFYTVERQFRITGDNGSMQFEWLDNSGMVPQPQGISFGEDMGMRKPVFDVKVSAQSKTVYTQNSQNELAMGLANMGVFNPQMVDQSLLLLDAMDFDGKDAIINKISEAGTMQQMFAQVAQIALALAQQYDPPVAEQLSQIIMQRGGAAPMPAMPAGGDPGDVTGEDNVEAIDVGGGNAEEASQVKNARKRAAEAGSVK